MCKHGGWGELKISSRGRRREASGGRQRKTRHEGGFFGTREVMRLLALPTAYEAQSSEPKPKQSKRRGFRNLARGAGRGQGVRVAGAGVGAARGDPGDNSTVATASERKAANQAGCLITIARDLTGENNRERIDASATQTLQPRRRRA